MKRRLIKQKDSFTVTLPIKWIKDHGVDESREVDMQEEKEGIIIQAEGSPKKKETEINITSEREPFIKINLNNIYRLGSDRMKVTFQTKRQKNLIQKTVEERLLGFEITEIKGNSIIIENVAEPSAEKQEVMLRRMFLIIKQSLDQIHQDFIEKKYPNLVLMDQNTQKIGQYDNFCRRNVSKRRFTEERVNFYWALYDFLLTIQYSVQHLYEVLDKNPSFKISDNELKIFEIIQRGFDLIYNGYYKKDLETLRKVHKELKNILFKTFDEMKKSKGVESVVLYYFGELARLVYLSASPILGILL